MMGSARTVARRKVCRCINRRPFYLIPLRFVSQIFGSYVTTLSPRSLSLEKLQRRFKATHLCEHSKEKYREVGFYLRPEEETYSRQIRRVILKDDNRTVEDVIQSLQRDETLSGFELTSPVVDSLLQNFGDDWKSAFGLFEWASLRIGYRHSSYACNKMVDLLGKMRKWDRMWDLVEDMREGCSITLDTIAKIMRRLAGGGKWKDAIVVFDKLESMGFVRDTETMNLLLDTLCKEKKVEVAREAFVVLKSHIRPNAYTLNIFVHGWCNARRVDEAMWTIREMKLWGLKPSVITYSTILQAYCNQANFQKVYELLDLMVSEGCPPNVVTYTTIMYSLAKSGNFGEALSIADRMKSSGCKPDTLFYNFLINTLGRAGQVHGASKVFEIEMEMNGVDRSLSTYNTMISMFCHHGQEQKAFNVLIEMEKASCKPDIQTYRPLLRLCFSKRELNDHIKSLLNDIMDKHNLSLDLDTYTLLIHGLCRIGDAEWACLLFDEMLGQEILPRYETCKLLMDEARRKNMEANVERIQTAMGQLGYVP